MAITPTGAIYKTLTFDGESSGTYGVYITGNAVFNAPERAVEMITIPGRNGAFALDQGRFENIEVTYPAGIFADNEADFAEAVSEFRNFLCSRKGYVRLTDDYNPDEYRLAVYKSGLEVEPSFLRAGEFDITFECKPQRFLTSGEEPVSVSSSDTITNPTLFESSPLLLFEATVGDASVTINGETVRFFNADIGTIELSSSPGNIEIFDGTYQNYPLSGLKNLSILNNNDIITFNNARLTITNENPTGYTIKSIVTEASDGISLISFSTPSAGNTLLTLGIDNLSFQKDDNAETVKEIYLTMIYKKTGSPDITYNGVHLGIRVVRNNVDSSYFRLRALNNFNDSIYFAHTFVCSSITGYSTQPTLTGEMYFDFEIGEAYRIVDGDIVSINNAVSFGAELPVLNAGANTITYQGGMNNVRMVPRWWKV